ncbi:hypothetical protein [Bacillus infantis]|uniref:hypothetical protein n=1 Tax=Bacillus infantis TaxID=324767 RepID=UPI003CE87A67
MKRYSMQYTSDKRAGWEEDENGNFVPSYNHQYGIANSIKTCRQYISKCKKRDAEYNPRNFRIYDHFADVDTETNYVPCVYQEQ